MLTALEVEQPVCWKYTGSSDGARLRPTSSWELDVRWFEEPLVTMISRIVVFEMAYDTTIEVNEPGCPSEVGHPIILCHGSNPFVRKFKFRFKFTTISGSHKCLIPPLRQVPDVLQWGEHVLHRQPLAVGLHRHWEEIITFRTLSSTSTISTDLGLKKKRDVYKEIKRW